MHKKSFVFGVVATLAFVSLLAAKPANDCLWCSQQEQAFDVYCYGGGNASPYCQVRLRKEMFERELVEDGFVRWNGNGAFYNVPK